MRRPARIRVGGAAIMSSHVVVVWAKAADRYSTSARRRHSLRTKSDARGARFTSVPVGGVARVARSVVARVRREARVAGGDPRAADLPLASDALRSRRVRERAASIRDDAAV